MPKLDRPATIPMSGALCSTAKCITIREIHTDNEDSDLGLVKWSFEGRLPAKGNASEIWKDAKAKKELFKIESDIFGPVNCSWRLMLKADFSATEPPTHVSFYVSSVTDAIPRGRDQKLPRIFCWEQCSIHVGFTKLFTPADSKSEFWSMALHQTYGYTSALTLQFAETNLKSAPFLTCSITLAFHATPHSLDCLPPVDQYLEDNKLSDIALNVKTTEKSITIPAHRMVLAASSDFFRSKFDFDESAGSTSTAAPNQCDINDYSEPCIRAMLEFMYTRRIDQHMPENLDDKLQLIAACDFYQVSGMHQFVAPHILQNIAPDNAIQILATGYQFRAISDALAKGAAKYVKSNWTELGSIDAFSDSLTVDGVGDLLKYALKGK
ncbi:Kelch-like protein 8 [Rhizophlyctis rosea]|uniref:Kelch-like protein 8 n=1 Tax=Rhizophlyctis rosea TaxID=64517 RepID=A0AAD5X5H7_9FUNG|nr:Kelch-like protein 8 [Rhizophlyctis rosea]